MFENYTEPARRTLFFARYAVSEFGGQSIETEHVLLALLRENNGASGRILRDGHVSRSMVEREMGAGAATKVPTSVDLPFSNAVKRALARAAHESERMGHTHITCDHLLLGLLWEKESVAGRILTAIGLRPTRARDEIIRFAREESEDSRDLAPQREPRVGDIVHYHTPGGRGLVTSAAIVTSVVNADQGLVTLTVFPPGENAIRIADARPGPLGNQPHPERWTWPIE